MSVAFDSKSSEMESDEWNLIDTSSKLRSKWRFQNPVCWIGAAALCLGLLLLTLILVAHNTSSINRWDAKYASLIYKITKGQDSLRDERDVLQTHVSNLTGEMEMLKSKYMAVVASRDKLQDEINKLTPNRTNKPCPEGWKTFEFKCYFISPSGASKNWESSREDCQNRGGDLVVINSREEMNFVKKNYRITWIGLQREGTGDTWKWVDGTALEGDGFWQEDEPNNADGEEDCVELSRGASAWNDVPCSRKFSWVCEN